MVETQSPEAISIQLPENKIKDQALSFEEIIDKINKSLRIWT